MEQRAMGRLIFVGCVFLEVMGFINSHPEATSSCLKVKKKFAHLNIGSEELVPENPLIDEGLKVCSRALTATEQRSCCSQDSEVKYVLAGERYLMESIRSENAYLKSLISKHLFDYEENLLRTVKAAENRTGHQLTDWYTIPWSEHRLAISNLFVDLQEFIKLKPISIANSISKFFDNIFPVLFKNSIYDRTATPFSHHFHHCLSKHRQEFRPRPFGNFPDQIGKKLSKSLLASRAYVEALNVLMEAINTTDHLIMEDGCKHAVTRLEFCSHCRGFVDIKPCKGFCLDVMRGCLTKLSEIGPEWNDVITSVESLVRELSGDNNILRAFDGLVGSISDALMHAMAHAPEYYQSVQSVCNLPSDTDQGRDGAHKVPDVSKVSVSKYASKGSDLLVQVMQVALDLMDAKGLYTNLADDICAQSSRYEQDPLSGTCWNGTEVSVYMREVVDANILSQARNNKEVKVSLLLDPKLRSLKDKMSVVNLKLQNQDKKDARDDRNVMLSDDPAIYAGSGSDAVWRGNVNIGAGTTLSDDEDFDELSGSGSGQGEDDVGTDSETDVIIHGKDKIDRPYDTNRGGDFEPDRPPHQKPKQQPRGDGPNGVSMATPVSLWLLLCLAAVTVRFAR